jgi:hypothetical protein
MKMAKEKRTSKFRGKVSKNTQKQRTQGASYGHLNLPKGLSVFKEQPGGRASLDFIPYIVTDTHHMDKDIEAGIAIPGNDETNLWYKKPYRLHRNIGSENKSVVCPTTWGKPCPICEYKAARLKDGAEYDDVKELKPSLRNLYLVVPLGIKEYKEEVHIWDISQFLFQDKLNEELDENEEYCVFPDIEDGLTVKIRFSEETFMKNKFAATSRIDFEKREGVYEAAILDDIPCLDDCLTCPSYAEVEAIFHELGDAPTDAPDPDDVEEDISDEREPDHEPEKLKAGLKRERKTAVKEDSESNPEHDKTTCAACGGEGVNSKGGLCRPCGGSGRKKNKEEDPESTHVVLLKGDGHVRKKEDPQPVEEKKTVTKTQTTHHEPKQGAKCPYEHKFGVDTDEYEDCDECDKWDDCIEAKENS